MSSARMMTTLGGLLASPASAPPPADALRQATAADVAASAAAQLETKPVNEAAGANAAMNITAGAAVSAASGIDATTVNKGLGLK